MPDNADNDRNFPFPVKTLESSRVVVVPFEPSVHGPIFVEAALPYPELYTYLPWGPFPTLTEFLTWYNSFVQSNPATTAFAIFDKTVPASPAQSAHDPNLPGAFAGIIGLLNTTPQHSSTEIGMIVLIPPFQRTHVNRNAVGLLLHYTLDLPAQGGLGFRRVQWQANAENGRSVRAAESIGFIKEGIIRWQRMLPVSRTGVKREGSDVPGRHTAMLAICWDDWEGGVRDKVDHLMEQIIL